VCVETAGSGDSIQIVAVHLLDDCCLTFEEEEEMMMMTFKMRKVVWSQK